MRVTSVRESATGAQLAASDPEVSAFVAASAGSGKTKLLTDRLLRLMLLGARPERIQCLTFTKAAAAEMALRLQRRLGEWVRLDDAALDRELLNLNVRPDAAMHRIARELFAKVLDLPGGMRIGTIHAFCQSLLRRFPLEAALSPHFRLIEDNDAAAVWTEAREAMLSSAGSEKSRKALDLVAGLANARQFGCRISDMDEDRERLSPALALGPEVTGAAQRRVLAVTGENEAVLVADACCCPSEEALRAAAETVAQLGADGCAARAQAILDWLAKTHEHRRAAWLPWREIFVTAQGKPRAASGFVNTRLHGQRPDLGAIFVAESERIIAVDDACRALRVAERSAALMRLAVPVLENYARQKTEAALVDYEDLIHHTRVLLHDPGAAWVLYKLDGGLDHLLLDEVQDTSPAQWRLAHALVAEFFAGMGARDAERTIFAVGDRKQSIYSFQGADVAAFDDLRTLLRGMVRSAGRRWVETPLAVSFRSTVPVLQLVDQVFADPVAARGVTDGEALRHLSDRPGQAGSVELWPLAPVPDVAAPPPWRPAEDYTGLVSAPQRLAERLAVWIATEISGGSELPSRGRAMRPDDVLVLVRRRNDFARALVRELKARGVSVAGLDRLVLTEQPAVQDLLALCDALLLPEDDLSFACFLTSPLGGLSDNGLMELAVGRRGRLWEELRDRAAERQDWKTAWEMFAALRARVDYASPHALLTDALGMLGGHTRLFGRLGPQAGEPVDELLNAALAFARTHPPSLQAFLHWLRRSGAEVKREQGDSGGAVRVMTVHGAKGLQAPVVILPDTTSLPPRENALVWAPDRVTGCAIPLWAPRKALSCSLIEDLKEAAWQRCLEEHNRLLYVALTRTEDRLVVCGWEARKAPAAECWYRAVERGFARLGGVQEGFADWGDLVRVACPQTEPPDRAGRQATSRDAAPLPGWLGRPPAWQCSPVPVEPDRPQPLAPSRPEGVELGPVPSAASPFGGRADRFARGRLVHALLQYLPDLPREQWERAAGTWLARPGHDLPDGEAERIVAEALGILNHPELAGLFAPGSRAEVPLSGVVGASVVGGLVDRMVVLPDRVVVADYKTNRRPPARVEDTPVLYRRQMAAYRDVLRQVFPGRQISCVLVWTHTGQVTVLPDHLLG